jgi:hypothetical protein
MKIHLGIVFAIAAIAGCGSQEENGAAEAAAGDQAQGEDGSARAEAAPGDLAIKPLPENTNLTLKFKGTINAARNLADSDPLGARSSFKIAREFDLTCRMVATSPRGIGPDGPTREQQAILDAAQAESDAAGEGMSEAAETSELQKRAAACGDDFACQMRVATEIANDPAQRRAAEAEEERNAGLGARLEAAADRVTAVQLEPNWQFLAPDVSPYGDGEPACTGTITANDSDVFRYGFDGGDMGEGVKSRTGTAEADDGGAPELWFDLKGGRLIVDTRLNAVRGDLPAACTGECEASWIDAVSLNDDWGASAGEVTRLEKGGETQITGKRLFSSDILPERHNKFSGGGEFELEVSER